MGMTFFGGIWHLIEKQGLVFDKLIDRDSGVWVDSNNDSKLRFL
jgi:hypothetical protein